MAVTRRPSESAFTKCRGGPSRLRGLRGPARHGVADPGIRSTGRARMPPTSRTPKLVGTAPLMAVLLPRMLIYRLQPAIVVAVGCDVGKAAVGAAVPLGSLV